MDALRIFILICFTITLTSTSDLEGLVQSEKELMFEDESEELSDRMDRDVEAVAGDNRRGGIIAALAGFPEAIDELINGKKSRAAVSKPKNGSRIIPIVGRIIKSLAARHEARAAKKMDKEAEPKVEVTVIQEVPRMVPEMSRVQEGDDRSSNVGAEESTGNAKREAQQGGGPKVKGMPIPAGYILWHPVSADSDGIEGAFSEQQMNFSPNQRMHNSDHPHRPFFIPLRQPAFHNQQMPQFGTPSLFALPPISAAAADASKKREEINAKNKKVPKQQQKNKNHRENERNKPQFNLPNQRDKPQFNLPNVAPNHFPNSPFFEPQLNQVNRPFPPSNFPQPNHHPHPQFGPQNQNRPFPPPPPPQQFNFNNPLPQNGPHFSESQQFFHHHRPNPMLQQQQDLFHHINRFGPPHPDQFPQPSINVPFQFQQPPFRPRPNPGAHPAKFQIEHEKKMRAEFGPFMPPPPPPPHFNHNMLPPHLPPPPLPHQFPPFIPMDHPPMNDFGPPMPEKPFNAKENNKFANANHQRPNVEMAQNQKVRNSNGPKNSNVDNGRPINAGSNFRPKKPDFESEKPNFEAKKPNFGPGNSNFEAGKPNFEFKKPNLGVENPNFENERPHFEHGKPHFEPPRRPGFDQGKPNFERERPHFNPERPHFNEERPHFNEERPNFNKEKPNFNEERPHFNEERPNFNKEKPNFNKERPSNFNEERPHFNQERPNFNQRPNNFEAKKPNSGSANSNSNPTRANFNSPNPNFDPVRPNFGPNNLHLEAGRQNFGPGGPINSRPVHANFEVEASNFKSSATSRFSSTTPKPMMFEASSTMMTPVIARDFHKLPPTPHTPPSSSSKNTPKHQKETVDNSFEYPPFGLPPTKAPPIVDVTPLNIYPHLEAAGSAKKPDMIFEHFQVQEPKVGGGNGNAAKVKSHSEGTHPPPLVHHLPPPAHYAADTYLEQQLLSEVNEYVATTPKTMTSSKKTPKNNNWSKNSPESVRSFSASASSSASTPATVYQYEVKYSSPLTFKPTI